MTAFASGAILVLESAPGEAAAVQVMPDAVK
jgi:hypothetical protein